jgi:long-chain acyl-CoA synthetase
MAASSLLFARAEAEPDRIRFLSPERVTLGELSSRVRSVASWLVGRGVKPGDHVAIWGDNGLEWAIAAWAVQAAGAAFVTIHAPASKGQADFIVRDSGAVLTISDSAHDPQADLLLDTPAWQEALATPPAPLPDVGPDDRACLIYTSGTTGDPKGVVLTHRNLWVNGEDWLQVVAPLLPEDAIEVHWLPMSHIFGWGALCIGTVYGLQTALCGFFEVAETALELHPHFLCGVPLLWDNLPPAALGDRYVLGLSGAAPLSTATKERYAAAGRLLLEGYGLTETSPTLTLEHPDQASRDTVGRPYPSVEIRIAPDGEVLARGDSVFAGYWNRTDQPFDTDGWFHTGDLGRFQDGALQLIGRKKELIVLSGGKKVAPAGIEARFPPHLGRLVLVGDNRKDIGALVFSEAGDDPSAAIEHINGQVARFERIRSFRVFSELPSVENGLLTPSLKLKRHVVADRYRTVIDSLCNGTRRHA